MADEGSEGRATSMDLNLYLGLPCSPRPRSLDLGSDLALSSLPLSESSNSEEIRAPEAAPGVMEGPAPNDEYSPFHTTVPESEVLLAGFRPSSDVNPNHEYPPCFSSYEPFGHSYAQDTEGPVLPYSPSNAPAVSVEDEIALIEERDGGFSAPFNDGAPINLIDDPFVEGSGSHLPYSPNYLPQSASLQEDETLASYTSMPQHVLGDSSSRGDGTSLQHELLQSPEFRIRRLVESQRWRMRRFRSSVTFGNERPAFFQQVSSTPIDLMQDMVSSPRPSDTYGKHKVPVEGAAAESSEEDTEMKNRSVANFECNICFDIAKEPVVTSCGHLFCWSCLYQWLHVHSDHKECPVCKGEVTEANIFPIYGRGKSGSDKESKEGETSESGVKIPPRPRGNRLESWRQHLRPISRRFGEGITHSLRRLLNHQIRNRTRFGGHEDSISQELLNGGSHVVLTRSMAREIAKGRSYYCKCTQHGRD
ncbi:hypothetical protein HPP92_022048 [Vanilla planifolia]|uniref:E3 ubiquitin-protein ligase RMA n=1 Tax=Vanilla planifolia TaxID=51239 RepID=A0A835PMU6_VANPL|nr:hypothetical protein HPP92_022048 [Vanilla planifolia]